MLGTLALDPYPTNASYQCYAPRAYPVAQLYINYKLQSVEHMPWGLSIAMQIIQDSSRPSIGELQSDTRQRGMVGFGRACFSGGMNCIAHV